MLDNHELYKKQNGNTFRTKMFPFHFITTLAAMKCQATVIMASSSDYDPFKSCLPNLTLMEANPASHLLSKATDKKTDLYTDDSVTLHLLMKAEQNRIRSARIVHFELILPNPFKIITCLLFRWPEFQFKLSRA